MIRFSKFWKSSKKPRKQRKYRRNAPSHIKHKMISSHLSPELIKKHNIRSIPVRKGDTVKIMIGDHKGKTGKVGRVSLKLMKVYLENITRDGIEGKKSPIPFEPSNLMVTLLQEDKKRIKEKK